jgi:hypothetical protein
MMCRHSRAERTDHVPADRHSQVAARDQQGGDPRCVRSKSGSRSSGRPSTSSIFAPPRADAFPTEPEPSALSAARVGGLGTSPPIGVAASAADGGPPLPNPRMASGMDRGPGRRRTQTPLCTHGHAAARFSTSHLAVALISEWACETQSTLRDHYSAGGNSATPGVVLEHRARPFLLRRNAGRCRPPDAVHADGRWRGTERVEDVVKAQTGQILVVDTAAPGLSWP